MLILSLVLVLVLLTLFFGNLEEKQHNPNQVPISSTEGRRIEVVLEQNKSGHYVTTGTINNQSVEFLLDTGATEVIIPQSIADRLGLQSGYESQVVTANGLVNVYATEIFHLSIGPINLTNISAMISPSMHTNDILLGMSALKYIEFSQQGSQLTLRQYF